MYLRTMLYFTEQEEENKKEKWERKSEKNEEKRSNTRFYSLWLHDDHQTTKIGVSL